MNAGRRKVIFWETLKKGKFDKTIQIITCLATVAVCVFTLLGVMDLQAMNTKQFKRELYADTVRGISEDLYRLSRCELVVEDPSIEQQAIYASSILIENTRISDFLLSYNQKLREKLYEYMLACITSEEKAASYSLQNRPIMERGLWELNCLMAEDLHLNPPSCQKLENGELDYLLEEISSSK